MFLLTLALIAAPVALPAAEPQRRARTSAARRARVRTAVRMTRLLPVTRVRTDHNKQYRLTDTPDNQIDFKTRVVERGTFKDCGVTGMPVCPSKGVPVLQSEHE